MERGIDTSLDERAVLAVLLLVLEPIRDAALVECALGAGLGEVRMRLGKETAGLGRVVPFGHVRAKPAVARAVLIPEGMVDGKDGVAPFGRVHEKPEDLMVGTGMDGGGWHPSEIGEDIGLGLELLPLRSLPGMEHRNYKNYFE